MPDKAKAAALRAAWNRASPEQRMAFTLELIAVSKPHGRTFTDQVSNKTHPTKLVRKVVGFARGLTAQNTQ